MCQLTELSKQVLPEFSQFYRVFPDKYPFLLNSSSKSSSKKQFDILFIDPEYHLTLDRHFNMTCSAKDTQVKANDLFLEIFDQLFAAEKKILEEQIGLPFTGGWFVFFAYEFTQQLEKKLQAKDALERNRYTQLLPIAYAARVKQALIYDHQQDKVFFISEAGIDHNSALQLLLNDTKNIQKNSVIKTPQATEWRLMLEEEEDKYFLNATVKVQHYIKEGDVFQVNLSRLWRSQSVNNKGNKKDHSQQAYYLLKQLNKSNPAPFSGLASFSSKGAYSTIISSSPERLLKVKDNKLESRPIAGTRPRSPSDKEDSRLLDELHNHPKEQAEHIMLIDLIRNDLGRVCIPGSVIVDELMVNESYAHVHHIVSNVIGELRADVTPGDVLKALFPGGTITGCPKIRCMEIIAELEQQSRAAYTGSMGYINCDGSMDLNILIRTMLLEDNLLSEQQTLSFRAGAGLVFDSIADKELQETRAKAKGLLNSLRV